MNTQLEKDLKELTELSDEEEGVVRYGGKVFLSINGKRSDSTMSMILPNSYCAPPSVETIESNFYSKTEPEL